MSDIELVLANAVFDEGTDDMWAIIPLAIKDDHGGTHYATVKVTQGVTSKIIEDCVLINIKGDTKEF